MIVDNELLKMSKGSEKMGDTFTMNKSCNGKNVTECHKMDDDEMKIDDGNGDDVESSASDHSDLEDQNLEEAQNHFDEKAEVTIGMQHVCNLKIWMI